jgi:tRNA-Thr(GGU) m(6)t(6)A37 methyltransferase TsaA
MQVTPIGIIHTPFTRQEGTPIQPALADGAVGWIDLNREYVPALKDLDGFERIWLLYWFDRAGEVRLEVVPYLDTVMRGLFATRAPARPNPLGISCVHLLGCEGNILRIADVDMLDGTPLLDIKPYAPRFDCFEITRSGWIDEASLKPGVADARFSINREGNHHEKT